MHRHVTWFRDAFIQSAQGVFRHVKHTYMNVWVTYDDLQWFIPKPQHSLVCSVLSDKKDADIGQISAIFPLTMGYTESKKHNFRISVRWQIVPGRWKKQSRSYREEVHHDFCSGSSVIVCCCCFWHACRNVLEFILFSQGRADHVHCMWHMVLMTYLFLISSTML